MISTTTSRHGTVLIIVAGISAILAAMALTFLARMRGDVEESRLVLQHAQAKIMLAAACSYVQEASRVGYDRYYDADGTSHPARTTGKRIDKLMTPIHEEAFGWIDARNGKTGPRDRNDKPFFPDASMPDETRTGKWPGIGGYARCPMYRMKIPPWGVKLNAAYNPMVRDKTKTNEYLYPLLRYPDPMPVTDNKWTIAGTRSVTAHPMKATSATQQAEMRALYDEHAKGDRQPVGQTTGRAWFRVYRDGPGTFVVTCGAGGTEGFKNWDEVEDEGEEYYFGGPTSGPGVFESLRQSEIRLWYRIEWSAAVLETSYHNLHHEVARDHEHYLAWPPNSSHTWSDTSKRTQTWVKNSIGTIRWTQRLMTEPTNY